MNVLITGPSGTIGRELLKQLIAEGRHRVTVFDCDSKQSRRILGPLGNEVNVVFGDIANRRDVDRVTSGQDVVIHLAGIIPPLADAKPGLAHCVNVIGTKNLVESLEENAPEAFLMFSSSVSVYGDRLQNPMISVNDPLFEIPGDHYAVTKIEAERIIRESKLRWSIFRLSAIMGAFNHKISKLMFQVPLNTSMEFATPEDTARAFCRAIDTTEPLENRIFNLGGGAPCRVTYRGFLIRSFRIFGLGKLNFPKKAFAEQNFHCGYYADGDQLNDLLGFRSSSVQSYFQSVRSAMSPHLRNLATIFRWGIKQVLLSQSEPYRAYHRKDLKLMQRFFPASRPQATT